MEAPRRSFAPIACGALALGLAIGLALPLAARWFERPPPVGERLDSYVGVLAGPEGGTGLVVSVARGGRVLDTSLPLPVGMPVGRTLYLWVVEASGAVQPVGPVPATTSGRITLRGPADDVFASAVEFGVTLERTDAPPETPAGAFVYRGPCGRLWRVAAPIG